MNLRWLCFGLLAFLTACASMNLVDVRSTTVKVSDGFGHGSGTFVSPDTVLTAAHVVRPDGPIQLEFPDGSKVGATVLWIDDKSDAALLKADTKVKSWSPIICESLKLGERVFTFGNPGILRFVLTEGVVAATETMGAQKANLPEGMPSEIEPMLTVSADWEPGDSGAAVFDKRGRVRGVVSIVFGTDRGGVSNNALITPVTVLPMCRGKAV
jgi:S1-C subfamily serine protease